MTTNGDDKTGETRASDSPKSGQPLKVRWGEPSMRSIYANVCHVAGTREEIVLRFGMNHEWHSGEKEVTIQLTSRIVMSPYAAKRLSILLNNVIEDYESKYGLLPI